jgi:hypothetical protein
MRVRGENRLDNMLEQKTAPPEVRENCPRAFRGLLEA